jgi:uncharacterized protein (DUF2249 family)
MNNNPTVKLDVRDDIRNGREPFSKIMSAAAALRTDEQLLLIAPFEPVPLFRVMEKQGFRHKARRDDSGDWEVLFVRQSDVQSTGVTLAPCHKVASVPDAKEIVEVDACGLEPPQPLVKILESLAALPAGAELRAWTDRRPMHLYAQLEERGFAAETEEQSNGSFITHIRRPL